MCNHPQLSVLAASMQSLQQLENAVNWYQLLVVFRFSAQNISACGTLTNLYRVVAGWASVCPAVQSISKDGEGLVSHMHGRLHLEGSVKSTKWKLTWLPDIPDLVPLQLVDFGHLITKKRIEEDDVFENFVNPESVRHQAV